MGYDPDDPESGWHESIDYRPDGESRHTIPAEICLACSDMATGRLVPVSFCPVLGPGVAME